MNTKKKIKYNLLVMRTWPSLSTERGREEAMGPTHRSIIKNYDTLIIWITPKVTKLRLQREP